MKMQRWLIEGTEEEVQLAIELYEEAIAQQPDSEGAKAMRRLIQSLKEVDETELAAI